MGQFTSQWLYERQAKRCPDVKISDKGDNSPEKLLHEKIAGHCKMKGWYVVHSRMDMPATNGLGTPDFIIATRSGTFYIEAKRKGKKPTAEQRSAIHWLKTLGHTAEIVWSFDEFLEVAKGFA